MSGPAGRSNGNAGKGPSGPAGRRPGPDFRRGNNGMGGGRVVGGGSPVPSGPDIPDAYRREKDGPSGVGSFEDEVARFAAAEPPPRSERVEDLSDDGRAEMVRSMLEQQQAPAPPQVFMCCMCVNDYKIALQAFQEKLQGQKIVPGSDEWNHNIQQAVMLGNLLMQQPGASVPPEVPFIPGVRPADVMVNGNTICGFHFQPQGKPSALLVPGSNNWRG